MNNIILKYFSLFFLMTGGWYCADQPKAKVETRKTKILVAEKEYLFGKINSSDTILHTYLIVNSGIYDLIINDVKASCGCTDLNWTKEPVKPGDTAFVNVVFVPNSIGRNEKSIVVNANTDSTFTVLYLKGDVEKAK